MRHLLQRVVAGKMAVAVVDALEAIDVDHQAGNGSAAALGSRQFLLQPLL